MIFYVAVTGHWLSDVAVQKRLSWFVVGLGPVSVSSRLNPMVLSYFLWFLGWLSLVSVPSHFAMARLKP